MVEKLREHRLDGLSKARLKANEVTADSVVGGLEHGRRRARLRAGIRA